MVPGISIEQLIVAGGVFAVAGIIFAESGILIGFFLPGDSLIFTAGFLVSQNIFDINIWWLCSILAVAAIAGDSVGYEFGNHYGRKLFNKKDGRIFKASHLVAAQRFYEKHGSITIVVARFIPIIRTFAPIVAGIANMTYRHFIAYNIIGATAWTFGVTLIGYYLGHWFTSIGLGIDQVLLPAIALILFISVLPAIIHLIANKKSRTMLFDSLRGLVMKKSEIKKIDQKSRKNSKDK